MTDQDRPPTPRVLSRRNVLIGSALGLAALGGGAATYAFYGTDNPTTPDPVPSPTESTAAGTPGPSATPGGERLGAMVGAPVDAQDVARWREDVDTLVEFGQTLVRTGVYAWEVAPEPNVWDDAAAAFAREQLDYARQAGLEVNLVVPGAPDWAQSYSFADYEQACRWFWTKTRETFGHQVALWQPYNEADHAHYQKFTAATRDAAYLGEFAHMLGVAKEVLGVDGVPITTNLTGWPLNDETEKEWNLVLDAISAPLDVISIDLYPADNEDEIGRIAARMQRIKKKYGKPVYVAEIGLQTTADSWNESEQQRYVSAALRQLRTVELWGICLYELRDNASPSGFGIKREDGSHKKGFDDVMKALAPR